MNRYLGTLAIAGLLGFVPAISSEAATLDCTAGCNGISFAGAIWTTVDQQSTGTGVIQSFVRISDNDELVSGMNTSGDLTQDENTSPTFTHDLAVSAVPVVAINGSNYYEFLLDINQQSSDPLLSLSALVLCKGTAGNQSIDDEAVSCDTATNTPIYNLAGNEVLLNYNLNSGSGSGDLFVYIPTSAVAGNFMYLWSEFGGATSPTSDSGNNDGFEEWAVRDATTPPVVPEPASLILLGTGLAGLGRLARRKLKK